MPTVGEIIQRLMPRGTLLQAEDSKSVEQSGDPIGIWRLAPIWPPDAFAVAATLVKYSECYTHNGVHGGMGLGRNHARETRQIGGIWSKELLTAKVSVWRAKVWNLILADWETNAADAYLPNGGSSSMGGCDAKAFGCCG